MIQVVRDVVFVFIALDEDDSLVEFILVCCVVTLMLHVQFFCDLDIVLFWPLQY